MRHPERVVVVLRPGSAPGRLKVLTRWVAWLLPTAVLLVAPAALPPDVDAGDVLTIDADEVVSGPLSLADALARSRLNHP